MHKKILFVSEALSVPFDEGIKNVAVLLHRLLELKTNSLTVTKAENNTAGLKISKIALNKLFLNFKLKTIIKNYSPDIIFYLPEASVTFNSFIRAKVLKYMSRVSKVVVLGVQHRKYSSLQSLIIANFLRPDLLLLLGKSDEDFFRGRGLHVRVLPPAVDITKFCPAIKEEKEKIRAEYNIPNDKTVVLHVGHIRTSRNIECFMEIQKIDNIQVIIIGSTSTDTEHRLKEKLVKAGVRVIDDFVSDISKIYKMSDVYVFPVLSSTAAIEMPLSVLEALACNLFILTTRFGGLSDYFKKDTGFKYFDTSEELIKLIRGMDRIETCNNRAKIEGFTWDRFADEIITAFEDLV
ncbi:MAG: glycosyltransferase family 4 protein [Nitrospirae bacterium]|nr:glycosyltransferase family 4 protein [Nitrospirota bacterium]